MRMKGGEATGWGRRGMPRGPTRPAKTFGHHLQTREARGTATPALGRGLQRRGCGEGRDACNRVGERLGAELRVAAVRTRRQQI